MAVAKQPAKPVLGQAERAAKLKAPPLPPVRPGAEYVFVSPHSKNTGVVLRRGSDTPVPLNAKLQFDDDDAIPVTLEGGNVKVLAVHKASIIALW